MGLKRPDLRKDRKEVKLYCLECYHTEFPMCVTCYDTQRILAQMDTFNNNLRKNKRVANMSDKAKTVVIEGKGTTDDSFWPTVIITGGSFVAYAGIMALMIRYGPTGKGPVRFDGF